MAALPDKIVFVDIETTGMRFNFDRIIEIGILQVEKDNEDPINYNLTKTFHSLINPEHHLPNEISLLTGITDQELDHAPTFREIKDEISEAIGDSIFVAHNVRFDYGFLKAEFKRLDIDFSPKHFCTVKLSKALFPRFKHHNLDALIERFNFNCSNRHRAFDDASILWEFYQIILKSLSKEKIILALNQVLKRPSRPVNIDVKTLDSLPESFGVYIFYGANGAPLYVGKSINIKERVLSHFSNNHSSSLEMKISQQVESIETIQTNGELGALIQESSLIKKLQPLYNRKLRVNKNLIALVENVGGSRFKTAKMESLDSVELINLSKVLGVFKNKNQAKKYLIFIANEKSLCEKLLNLENTKGACFAYRLNRCGGACIGKENIKKYNLRFDEAFLDSKIKNWPYNGAILIVEKNLGEEYEEGFLFDNWCFLGRVKVSLNNMDFEENDYFFDIDTYKILRSYLNSKKGKVVKILSTKEVGLLLNGNTLYKNQPQSDDVYLESNY
ncbi:GIY-YIG nuclease family protein [Candidatus Daviesbacteria bacterium]|nr:GIY-YIG nuclease family protein [Candidatus Daviesbacteria bacterium]